MLDLERPGLAALVLRLSLGVMFLAHALLKLLVFTPAGTAGFFESLGLPGMLAYLVIAAELVAAAGLILGIGSRWISLVMIPEMLGTILFAHGANGWSFANEGGGWEYPAFLTAALVAQVLLGDGAYALRGRVSDLIHSAKSA